MTRAGGSADTIKAFAGRRLVSGPSEEVRQLQTRDAAPVRCAAGELRMVRVLVASPDGTERWVSEPMFEPQGTAPPATSAAELERLMAGAGFHATLGWAGARALEDSGRRCGCGGELSARTYRREDPLCVRCFAACADCALVAFEF